MSITYPLSLPTSIGIAEIELRARNAVAISQSPFTFSTQTHSYSGQTWEGVVTIPPVRREFAEPWISFLLSLKGPKGTFLLNDPNCVSPQGVATGTPLVNNGAAITAGSFVVGNSYEIVTVGTTNWVSIGAVSATVGEIFVATGEGSGTGTATEGQTGDSLNIDGATSGVTGWLKSGDYIQLGSGQSSTLHKVLTDADSDGSGNVTLDIWPSIRNAPPDGSSVIVNNAKGLFRLSGTQQNWSINNSSLYGISFEFMEAI